MLCEGLGLYAVSMYTKKLRRSFSPTSVVRDAGRGSWVIVWAKAQFDGLHCTSKVRWATVRCATGGRHNLLPGRDVIICC